MTLSNPHTTAARTGGLVLALGGAGVVATSVLYGLSPPAAAMPVIPLDLAAALAGAVRGQVTMHLAGLIGVPGDVLVTAAGILLGGIEAARGRGLAAIGWFLIATSTILFAVVDSLVGFVLPPVAVSAPASFFAVKSLFDVLFLLGTATFGAGAVLALVAQGFGIPRLLAIPALLVGLIAVGGGLAGLLGVSVSPNLLGVGILGGSFLFVLIGLRLAVTPPG
jgi:hypothetical protein